MDKPLYHARAFWGRGMLNEDMDEFSKAIEYFKKYYEIIPTRIEINTDIGRCYRKLGQYQQAEEALLKTLKVLPYDPKTNYELALTYHEMGQQGKSMEHLQRTLTVWENADPDYKPAMEARSTLAEWKQSTK